MSLHAKPIRLLNVNHFFDVLLSFLDQAVDEKFISLSTRNILISTSTIKELLEKLHAYVPQHNSYEPWIDWFKAVRSKHQKSLINLELSL